MGTGEEKIATFHTLVAVAIVAHQSVFIKALVNDVNHGKFI
jgi:hypothetical protein